MVAVVQPSLFEATPLSRQEKKRLRELVSRLEWSFERHAHIVEHGAGGLFHHDGSSLFLVRNHIIHYKCEIAEITNRAFMPLPAVALRPTPPEYPKNYCVKCGPYHELPN